MSEVVLIEVPDHLETGRNVKINKADVKGLKIGPRSFREWCGEELIGAQGKVCEAKLAPCNLSQYTWLLVVLVELDVSCRRYWFEAMFVHPPGE